MISVYHLFKYDFVKDASVHISHVLHASITEVLKTPKYWWLKNKVYIIINNNPLPELNQKTLGMF